MENINFKSFQDAGEAVLKFLHQHFGFDLWMITRVEGALLHKDFKVKTSHIYSNLSDNSGMWSA
jgi:hypothetical protein